MGMTAASIIGRVAVVLTFALPLSAMAQQAGYPPQSDMSQGYPLPGQQPENAQDQAAMLGAPSGQHLSPQMMSDITRAMGNRLPPDFLPRARAAVLALQGAGIQPPNSTGMTLDQAVQAARATPGLDATLAHYGFDAAGFMIGITTFGMTLAATNGQSLPSGIPAPNPDNVALFHKDPQDVSALMQAMGTPPQSTPTATDGGQQ